MPFLVALLVVLEFVVVLEFEFDSGAVEVVLLSCVVVVVMVLSCVQFSIVVSGGHDSGSGMLSSIINGLETQESVSVDQPHIGVLFKQGTQPMTFSHSSSM